MNAPCNLSVVQNMSTYTKRFFILIHSAIQQAHLEVKMQRIERLSVSRHQMLVVVCTIDDRRHHHIDREM